MKSEFLDVAKKVLKEEGIPLTARQIWELGQDRKYFSDKISGKTPFQTMKAKLSVHVRTKGEDSVFVRTRPGNFYLRELLEGKTPYETPPLRPPKEKERILVFETKFLDRFMDFYGILDKRPDRRLSRIVSEVPHEYRARLEVEHDDAWTQVVTYVLVKAKGAILSYKRGTYNRLDSFLRGSRCVGFGGHVSEADIDLFGFDDLGIMNNASRELAEELDLPTADVDRLRQRQSLKMLGLLNDDSSDNGRRHFAVIYGYEVSSCAEWESPRRGEKSITQLRWLRSGEAPRSLLWNFEYWSQLCLRQFAPRLIKNTGAFWFRNAGRLRPPSILCVSGPVGSGKSEATRVLIEKFGYQEVNSGKIVAELLGLSAVPITDRRAFQFEAHRFISDEHGPRQLADAIWKRVQALNCARVLVDGVRQKATLAHLRTLASAGDRRLGLIFVHTTIDQAYDFYCGRSSESVSFADFLELRRAPVETEVELLIRDADAVLYNWTGKLNYHRTIVNLMDQLGQEPLT